MRGESSTCDLRWQWTLASQQRCWFFCDAHRLVRGSFFRVEFWYTSTWVRHFFLSSFLLSSSLLSFITLAIVVHFHPFPSATGTTIFRTMAPASKKSQSPEEGCISSGLAKSHKKCFYFRQWQRITAAVGSYESPQHNNPPILCWIN